MISFALTGLLVVLVMRMLGEMAARFLRSGASTSTTALALGDLAGFMTGWMYWYFWVIVVALEAVAGARAAGVLVAHGAAVDAGARAHCCSFTLLNLHVGALLGRGGVLVRLDQGGRYRRVPRRGRAYVAGLWLGRGRRFREPHRRTAGSFPTA